MSEIPKAYEPQSVEDKWYKFWLDEKCFVADATSSKPAYSIVIPPPNVTGMLHMGHVLNNTIQDILSRKARMDGKEVLWLPGTDHAGIATQMMVEKQIKKEEKKSRHDLGREEFLKRVWAWKEKHGDIIINQLKKLGCSCDWTRERFTMDPEYSRCVQKVFVELYKKGLIYRGKRMVNWCPVSQTALSDEEVEMKPQKGFMYHFKVQVVEVVAATPSSQNVTATPSSRVPIPSEGACATLGDEGVAATKPGGPEIDAAGRIWLTIATTRPETIPGDTAVAVNPKDPRYAHLIGKHIVRPLPAELPADKKLIPIIGDEHVDFEFGTGVLKVTPAHDKADFDIGARHKLPLIEVINADGSMNALAGGSLSGLDRFKARKVAVEILKEQGVLVEEKPYENNVGFSQRADVPIEPRLSEQWFLKYPAVAESKACVQQVDENKDISIIYATGKEFAAATIHELRDSAMVYARSHGFLGKAFRNEDSGIEIRARRKSLSHAFSNRGEANIKAVAVLPELIRKAIWISSEKHEGDSPRFKRVHRFVAALSLAGELYRVMIIAKELADGTVLYDHKTKKITPGGKSLVAHPLAGKLGIQPAPGAGITIADLLGDVNVGKMRFHPQRWAKVYDHWLTNIQDWCISRQLWWGHRIPVWYKRLAVPNNPKYNGGKWWFSELDSVLDTNHLDTVVRIIHVATNQIIDPFNLVLQEEMDLGKPEHEFDVFVCTLNESAVEHLVKDEGFTQDPDVLDTWFSSWLWPFATMGWPEQTDTLKKFYPTTDLVTGPDIIFFWVARMIMAGFEYMGEMPFRNVYFTGIIRDKQGRKMSKTLGNSPDPLVLISQYGADALRFGTMRSAPLGQDVLFDEKDVELGRNFCNKLWNACRFRQMVGGGDASSPRAEGGASTSGDGGVATTFEIQGEIVRTLLTPDDKWILLKLDLAIREVTIALNEYKFSEATSALYRFFWNEYCDWYVEASKAVFFSSSRGNEAQTEKSEIDQSLLTSAATAQKANTLAVIDFVLSHTIRLFHPFLPFITEELWHGMGYSTDMPAGQGGKTIMNAPWPMPLGDDEKGEWGLDDCYLEMTDTKYELVRNGRDLRRAGNIQAAKKVKYVFKPAQHLTPHDTEVIKLLLNAESLEVNEGYQPPKGTPSVQSPMGELFLPLEGLIDVAAEKIRLAKDVEKIQSEITKVEQKLANPNFTQKVPPAVLQEHEQRLADWKIKLAHAQAALEALNG